VTIFKSIKGLLTKQRPEDRTERDIHTVAVQHFGNKIVGVLSSNGDFSVYSLSNNLALLYSLNIFPDNFTNSETRVTSGVLSSLTENKRRVGLNEYRKCINVIVKASLSDNFDILRIFKFDFKDFQKVMTEADYEECLMPLGNQFEFFDHGIYYKDQIIDILILRNDYILIL
jgi:hypothetical protein